MPAGENHWFFPANSPQLPHLPYQSFSIQIPPLPGHFSTFLVQTGSEIRSKLSRKRGMGKCLQWGFTKKNLQTREWLKHPFSPFLPWKCHIHQAFANVDLGTYLSKDVLQHIHLTSAQLCVPAVITSNTHHTDSSDSTQTLYATARHS